MKDELGKSKGFGFVTFELLDQAMKATEALNGLILGRHYILIVGRTKDDGAEYGTSLMVRVMLEKGNVLDCVDSRWVRLSRWDNETLTEEQVAYAAADGFVSFEVGRRFMAGED